MEHKLAPYECQFSAEERKAMIASTLAQIRKVNGYSQKEVAGWIGISQATYSAYERGRNEPPAEILVRLSYLYGCKVDLLIQRDRLDKEYKSIQEMIDDLRVQLGRYEEAISRLHLGNDQRVRSFVNNLGEFLNQVEKMEE